eukprot:jgi/Tetstr1/456616/TSEL_043319.t1
MGQFRESSSATIPPASPDDFEAVFNLLGQKKQKRLKISVADTVFLTGNAEYVAVTSIITSKRGSVHRWGARRATFKGLWELAREWCSNKDREEPVAVARYVNASYTLTAPLLDELLQSITGCREGILGEAEEAPVELDVGSMSVWDYAAGSFLGGIPYALQGYVAPRSQTRYVTSFQWSDVALVCESYASSYGDNFQPLQRVLNQDRPSGPGALKVGSAGQLCGGQQSDRLRQMTLAIVNFVNRIHRCQLLGMVAEVIESDEGVQLLTGILGCCWPDQWARRRVLHPDGALSAASPPAVKPRPSGGRASLNVANDGGGLPGLNVPGGKRSTGSLDMPPDSESSPVGERSQTGQGLAAFKVRDGSELDRPSSYWTAPPTPRNSSMHVSTGRQSGNLNYFYTASSRGASEPNRAKASHMPPLDVPEVAKPGGPRSKGFGLHSDVAMILSPRYTTAGIWSPNSGAASSRAHAALAASGAAMARSGNAPPSYGLRQTNDQSPTAGSRKDPQGADISVRLTRRVEELRQALQEQAQQAATARIAETNALAKQMAAEQQCQALQSELAKVRREYDAFRIQSFNEKATVTEERAHALQELAKYRAEAASLGERYEDAKSRLDKERDVAFDLVADLRAQLNVAKGELVEHQAQLQASIQNSEDEKNFAVAELQEERAKNRSANKHVKMLEEVREALEIELKDERVKTDQAEYQKETMVLAMPELHLVMATMQRDIYAHASRESIDDLVRTASAPEETVIQINKILSRNTLLLRKIYLYYNSYLTNTGNPAKAMNQAEFVRFCRDCGIIESQIDKLRALDKGISHHTPAGPHGKLESPSGGARGTAHPVATSPRELALDAAPAGLQLHRVATPPGSPRQGAASGMPEQTQDIVALLCQDLKLPDLGNVDDIPGVFLRSMNVDQLFVQCVSNTKPHDGQASTDSSERFMDFHDFVHILVRVANLRYLDLPSLAARVLVLLFQAVFPRAKRVDLNMLLAYDKMMQQDRSSASSRRKTPVSPRGPSSPRESMSPRGAMSPVKPRKTSRLGEGFVSPRKRYF